MGNQSSNYQRSQRSHYKRTRRDRFVDVYQSSIVPAPDDETPVDWTRNITLNQAKQWLKQDLESSATFRAAWDEAESWFKDMYERQPTSEDDLRMVLIVYTMESFYQTLNEACMKMGCSRQGWDRFPYKGCWCLLYHAIKSLPPSPPGVRPGANKKCYRGVKFDVTPQLQGKKRVAFSHFASTSTSESEALNYTGGNGGSIFEINSVPSNALGIQEYSVYDDEEEVLVFPWSKFEVKAIYAANGNSPTRILLSPY